MSPFYTHPVGNVSANKLPVSIAISRYTQITALHDYNPVCIQPYIIIVPSAYSFT